MSTSTQDLIPAVEPEPVKAGKGKKYFGRWIAGIAAAAIAIGGYTYINYSTPVIVKGSTSAGPYEARWLPDKSEPLSQLYDHALLQTGPDAWIIWSVRNDGKAAVTLHQPACQPTGCAGAAGLPKVYFALGYDQYGNFNFPYYTDQGELQVAALSKHLLPSITIPAGEEGIVIAHFYFPSRCVASQDEIRGGSGLGSQSLEYLSLPASSLGRPSTINVPLNERFIRPLGHEWGAEGCVEDYYKWINSSRV